MADKSTFTPEEWKLLVDAPIKAGLAISKLDLGVVSFAREFAAMVKGIVESREQFAGNPLVQAVIADGDGEKQQAPSLEGTTSEALLADLAKVAALVDAKASPDEARGFKTFLFGISERTANASGSGLLGFGEKLSLEEKGYLEKLKSAFGI